MKNRQNRTQMKALQYDYIEEIVFMPYYLSKHWNKLEFQQRTKSFVNKKVLRNDSREGKKKHVFVSLGNQTMSIHENVSVKCGLLLHTQLKIKVLWRFLGQLSKWNANTV